MLCVVSGTGWAWWPAPGSPLLGSCQHRDSMTWGAPSPGRPRCPARINDYCKPPPLGGLLPGVTADCYSVLRVVLEGRGVSAVPQPRRTAGPLGEGDTPGLPHVSVLRLS